METSLALGIGTQKFTLPSDSFFFMSSYRSFRTSGCYRRLTVPAAGGEDPQGAFQRQLADAFAGARAAGVRRPRVVGAIPFDSGQPSALFIPERWQPLSCADSGPEAGVAPPPLTILRREEIPDRTTFMAMVARAAALTATPQLDKVVLSRLIDIEATQPPDRGALLARLIAQNPASFNFHVPLPDGGALLGASPELLLRKDGARFNSLPLAGSARRLADARLDREAGQRLLASAKDRHEHALVIRAMQATLAPRSRRLSLPQAPQLITTPTLWHLATSIEGATSAEENALSLACLLHPTPALSGFPHQPAKALIAGLEPFDRQLFGGIVGWCDDEGNGEWVVAIRCARVQGRTVRLFAGAGIVAASSPADEWRETSAKLATMLNVFGLQ